MASKAFRIICDVELGKPVALPNIWGRNSVRVTKAQWVEDTVKSECQSVIDWTEVQNLPQSERVQTYRWRSIVWTETNPIMWDNQLRPKARYLQTPKVLMGCKLELQRQNWKLPPDAERVMECLSGMKGNFHVPFFEEEEWAIALPYST